MLMTWFASKVICTLKLLISWNIAFLQRIEVHMILFSVYFILHGKIRYSTTSTSFYVVTFDDVKREERGISITPREGIPVQSCFLIEKSKYTLTWKSMEITRWKSVLFLQYYFISFTIILKTFNGKSCITYLCNSTLINKLGQLNFFNAVLGKCIRAVMHKLRQ